MLPIPILDDEGFHEIAENARSMIPRLSPSWTDFNYHDPGITFVELFAFLKESQQYHLDQIGTRNQKKYLKLLGLRRHGLAPARTVAVISGEENAVVLPRGTRLLAGEIPFETERTTVLSGGRLRGGFVWDGVLRTDFTIDAYAEMGKLRLAVFGEEPGAGATCYLRFDGPWRQSTPLRLRLWVNQDWGVERNPVDEEGFVPLNELVWEYLTQAGWREMQLLSDETQGLLFSGEISLSSDVAPCSTSAAPEEAQTVLGEEGYWLRLRLIQGSGDVPPVLTGLSDETVPVVQADTAASCLRLWAEQGVVREDSLLSCAGEFEVYAAEAGGLWQRVEGVRRSKEQGESHFHLPGGVDTEVLLLTWHGEFALRRHLAVGDGFPNQSYELPQNGQLAERFALLVEEPDAPGKWSLWERVEDFDASTPEDRHYLLEEESGIVHFGDCVHGMAPEGAVLIAGQAVTLGTGGNVKEGQLRDIHPEDRRLCGLEGASLRIRSPKGAVGGRGEESVHSCFLRCRQMMRQTDRAVTYADYVRLVRQTPGLMISNCKAVPVTRLPRQDGSLEENCVTVVVEPFSTKRVQGLSPAYRENILRYLEGRRMLGSRVSVQAPEYAGITIYAEILSQPHYLDARVRIQAAVADFFQKGWEFGSPVRYSTLYGIIDTLDCVQGIETLTIDAQGGGITRGVNGDVILPYNGLAVLLSASYQIRPTE